MKALKLTHTKYKSFDKFYNHIKKFDGPFYTKLSETEMIEGIKLQDGSEELVYKLHTFRAGPTDVNQISEEEARKRIESLN